MWAGEREALDVLYTEMFSQMISLISKYLQQENGIASSHLVMNLFYELSFNDYINFSTFCIALQFLATCEIRVRCKLLNY